VVLITFWFPGCGPCRAEFPHFENVVKKYNKKELVYLGINVLPNQDDYVLPFMKGTKYSFMPLKATSDWAEKNYGVRGEPTNFLLDKEGNIVFANFRTDQNNERTLELMINSLLEK
jgi:thiol-disulfide isomerase/thioredoxin